MSGDPRQIVRRPQANCKLTPIGVATHSLGTAAIDVSLTRTILFSDGISPKPIVARGAGRTSGVVQAQKTRPRHVITSTRIIDINVIITFAGLTMASNLSWVAVVIRSATVSSKIQIEIHGRLLCIKQVKTEAILFCINTQGLNNALQLPNHIQYND